MAKGMYSVIGGKSRKITKNYAVIGGVTRKIKKMYAVVNGVTRLIWSGGEITYGGTVESLSLARTGMTGTQTPNYAIFAGGYRYVNSKNVSYDNIDLYNSALTHSTKTHTHKAHYMGSTYFNNCLMFAGGYTDDTNIATCIVYDSSFTASTKENLLRSGSANGITHGSYAMFMQQGRMTKYDTSFTRIYENLDNYSSTYSLGNPIKNGANVIYVGWETDVGPLARAYNTSGTMTSIDTLTGVRIAPASALINGYAVYAGGHNPNSAGLSGKDTVEYYDTSLTKHTATSLASARGAAEGISSDQYAIIVGGRSENTPTGFAVGKTIELYDGSMTRTTSSIVMTISHQYASKALINGHNLITGDNGYTNTSWNEIVEVINV